MFGLKNSDVMTPGSALPHGRGSDLIPGVQCQQTPTATTGNLSIQEHPGVQEQSAYRIITSLPENDGKMPNEAAIRGPLCV